MADDKKLNTDFTITDAMKRALRRKQMLEDVDRQLSDVDALSRELEEGDEPQEVRDIFAK